MNPNHIRIFDTTLRDGEQSPGFSMNLNEKLQVAEQLALLGADVIEAGFPIASDGDFKAVREIAKHIDGPVIAGLSRIKAADIDRAWEALRFARKPRIHTFIATSDIHLTHKLGISRQQALDLAVAGVAHAKTCCEDVEFSAEDASRTDPDFLCQVFEAVIDAGATTVNIPDTVGFAVPDEFAALVAKVRTDVRGIDRAVISVHCHNDLGMGVANSLAAIRAGAGQVECCINGIGERAGNSSLEEVVMALNVRKSFYGKRTSIRTEHIYRTSQLLSRITGVGVQPNKAVVGRNAFAHEAGIHQDGMLKNPLTYEIMTPESVGVPKSELVLGKHSGRNALNDRLKHLGFEFTRDELDVVYKGFVSLADKQKVVTDADLVYLSTNGVTQMGDTFIHETIQRYLNKT
jgi:2-isopropylmalate synthase